MWGFISLGELLLSFVWTDGPSPAPAGWKPLCTGGLGAGAVSLVVLVLGRLPGDFFLKLIPVTLGLAFLGARNVWAAWQARTFAVKTPSRLAISEVVLLGLASFGIGVTFLSCFSPITYYDSLVYHLALPALYSRLGCVRGLANNLYSYFPSAMEMLHLLAINQAKQPEYVINLIDWLMSVGIGWGLYKWGEEIFDRRHGLLAMALWWTTPAVLLLSIGGYVDVPLAFFSFVSIRLYFWGREKGWDPRWLALAGAFSGMACSTKYTGAITPVLLMALSLLGRSKNHSRRAASMTAFCLAAGFPIAFWLLRNAIDVGNPFFPFFYRWFGGRVAWTSQTAAGYFQMLTEYGAKSHLLYELFLAPWQIAVSAFQYGGGFDVLGDFGWPLFLLGLPLAFTLGKKGEQVRWLLVYAAGHFALWLYTKPVLRFLISFLPVAALLVSGALGSLLFSKSRWRKLSAALLTTPWIVSNFFLFFFIAQQIQPFSVTLGLETPDAYLRRRLVYYPAFDYLNRNLSPDDRVLLIAEQRTYHLKVSYISSNFFAEAPYSEWCNKASGVDGLAARLKQEGISHILVNWTEIRRFSGLQFWGFDSKGEHLLTDFLHQRATLLLTDRGVDVYEIR